MLLKEIHDLLEANKFTKTDGIYPMQNQYVRGEFYLNEDGQGKVHCNFKYTEACFSFRDASVTHWSEEKSNRLECSTIEEFQTHYRFFLWLQNSH